LVQHRRHSLNKNESGGKNGYKFGYKLGLFSPVPVPARVAPYRFSRDVATVAANFSAVPDSRAMAAAITQGWSKAGGRWGMVVG